MRKKRDKTDRLLGSLREKRVPIGTEIFVPNHSGDHSKGRVNTTPVGDQDLVNKKYVDDQITANAVTPGGNDTEVQFNDSGSFEGDTAFTWDKTNNRLTIPRILGGGADPLNIGTGSTNHGLTTSNDLYVTGHFEADGYGIFDNDIYAYNNIIVGGNRSFNWGGYDGVIFSYSQTPYAMVIFVSTTSRSVILMDNGDKTTDMAHGAQTNPTFFIHSASGNTTQWISFTHDQTDGLIDVGAGSTKINGGQKGNVTTASGTPYNVPETDYIVNSTRSAAGAGTVNLLTATVAAGKIYHIKDAAGNAGTNNITVATQGAETIDGAAIATINTNYGSVSVYSDGTNWFTF